MGTGERKSRTAQAKRAAKRAAEHRITQNMTPREKMKYVLYLGHRARAFAEQYRPVVDVP